MKETIALIDDDRNILTSLSIALEKEGFKNKDSICLSLDACGLYLSSLGA